MNDDTHTKRWIAWQGILDHHRLTYLMSENRLRNTFYLRNGGVYQFISVLKCTWACAECVRVWVNVWCARACVRACVRARLHVSEWGCARATPGVLEVMECRKPFGCFKDNQEMPAEPKFTHARNSYILDLRETEQCDVVCSLPSVRSCRHNNATIVNNFLTMMSQSIEVSHVDTYTILIRHLHVTCTGVETWLNST